MGPAFTTSGIDSRLSGELGVSQKLTTTGKHLLTVEAGLGMVREVRQRGDNFAWKPDIYYDGDIADTDAVRAWITSVVLKPASKRH